MVELSKQAGKGGCCGGGGGRGHLKLVELRNLDAHAAPRQHPALGDGGGVHAAALLLLKLRGALARLLRFGLARLLCLPRLLLTGHRYAARVGLRGARVWRPRGGRASLGARLAKERIRFLGGPVVATALEAPVLLAPVAYEEEAELVALVARLRVTRLGEFAALRDETAQRRVGDFVAAACGDLHERRGGRTAQRAARGIATYLGEHAAAAH